MAFEVSRYAEQLKQCCEQFEVVRLDLFGSGVRDDFNEERSDLDFLVTFDEPTKIGYFDRYFGLMEKLSDIFNRKVDLVEEKAITNPYFRKVVNRERKLVFAR
ncbi:MAG: nucleotidyltransferase domain-containing protein [Acidobacteria bacterium]|nr:nucleotidyltransferase domain-containing protein [Acidobacteriota bacterium]